MPPTISEPISISPEADDVLVSFEKQLELEKNSTVED